MALPLKMPGPNPDSAVPSHDACMFLLCYKIPLGVQASLPGQQGPVRQASENENVQQLKAGSMFNVPPGHRKKEIRVHLLLVAIPGSTEQ